MSEITRAVIGMPFEMAMENDLSRRQFHSMAQALLSENERLKTLQSIKERDLAQELEVWHHGPSCWNCGDTGDVHDLVGEWRGKCDCFAAQLIDVKHERDQLKAENADLKTGYEAYDRVNAELRAECEALRKPLLAAREFIMHEAKVRRLLDENKEISFRHPLRRAVIAALDAAISKEVSQ
ncbi:hypothetical protein AL064_18880 [Pseudomonas syringae pv. syringae]|uniref:hypothetical protein n=1 Tax=Pseudomonas syringae TaxID=317 RepID=UPI000760A707|nr:hypothetical protein [Pseudomonas syringae]KWS07479.1 hypothetical protein AL064_18880 [Pseudomonas syringae pv. syringae]